MDGNSEFAASGRLSGSPKASNRRGPRLYNPESHQWSFNFASSSDATMNPPMIGEFKDGRGEFIDQGGPPTPSGEWPPIPGEVLPEGWHRAGRLRF